MQYNKQVKLIMNIFQNYQNLIFLKVQLNHYYHLKSIFILLSYNNDIEQYKRMYEEEKRYKEIIEKRYTFQKSQLNLIENEKDELTKELCEYHKEVSKLKDQVLVQDAMIKSYVFKMHDYEIKIGGLNKKLKALQDVTLSFNAQSRLNRQIKEQPYYNIYLV